MRNEESMELKENYRPLVSTDYKPLHTLLPLSSPLRLGIGLTTRCNFRCEFCYLYSADKARIPPQIDMPLALVEKCAENLCEFEQPISVADLSQNGEPLLYRDLATAIRLFKSTNKVKSIRIITNGSLLSPQKAEELLDAGLDQVMVSINGMSDKQYRKVVNVPVKFDTIYKNIEHLYAIKGNCHIHAKIIGNYFSAEEQQKFLDVFSPIVDSIHIDQAVNQWIGLQLPSPPYGRNEGVNRFNKEFEPVDDKSNLPMCNAPFYFLRIHPSGIASVCLGDWEAAMSLGDINNMSLKEVWNGKRLSQLRNAQLSGYDIPRQCTECHYYELMTGEDLTPFKEKLIQKYGYNP